MRTILETGRFGPMLRVFAANYGGEIGYVRLGLVGLAATMELPSTWHEYKRAWFRLSLGLITIAFSVPWKRIYPDHHQCAGPTYGFYTCDGTIAFCWGQDTGHSKDPKVRWHFDLPWQWRYKWRKTIGDPQKWEYHYKLQSGRVQLRVATIQHEQFYSTRPWLPWSKLRNCISVEFDGEVGEGEGSWKGGTIGCGYDMLPNESPRECLRRMERERKFSR